MITLKSLRKLFKFEPNKTRKIFETRKAQLKKEFDKKLVNRDDIASTLSDIIQEYRWDEEFDELGKDEMDLILDTLFARYDYIYKRVMEDFERNTARDYKRELDELREELNYYEHEETGKANEKHIV